MAGVSETVGSPFIEIKSLMQDILSKHYSEGLLITPSIREPDGLS
jgi:hypothetical protein